MTTLNTFQTQILLYGGGGGGTGSAGPQGTQGNQGWQGFVGTQGAQGFYGAQGDIGFGLQGNQGFRGNQGIAGNQGTQGGVSSINLFGGTIGSTSIFTLPFTEDGYYEITAPFWQTGTTGTIVVSFGGNTRTTTILQTYGIFKGYLTVNNAGNFSKFDYELMGNVPADANFFATPTYVRYAWAIGNPSTSITLSSLPNATTFYYVAVKKFTY